MQLDNRTSALVTSSTCSNFDFTKKLVAAGGLMDGCFRVLCNIIHSTMVYPKIPIARQYTWLSSNYDPDSHPENRESASRYWDKSFVFFGGVTPFLSKFV